MKANPVLSGDHSGQRDSGRPSSPNQMASSEAGGEIETPLWEALARAGHQVRDEWCSLSEDAVSAQEVDGLVERLVAGLRCVACHEADRPKLPLTILARRVLVLLRRNALIEIEQLADPPPAAELIRFLQAFEFIAEQLEPDWSGHLANRLSGPDGLEMVVEVVLPGLRLISWL